MNYDILLLIKEFRICPVMGPRYAVLALGRRPWANTADRGPVTGPIRNYLINDNFINLLYCMFEMLIETRLPCLYGLEKKQDMTSSLLTESYRVASVLAELLCIGRVYHSYDSDRFCHIHAV